MPRRVQIFTTSYCPYCVAAKALLVRRGIGFEETDVTDDASARARLVTMTGGRRTVPQIFVGGVPIGGCDELHELDRRGQLLAMVDSAA
jgi:glutaredoxin 3